MKGSVKGRCGICQRGGEGSCDVLVSGSRFGFGVLGGIWVMEHGLWVWLWSMIMGCFMGRVYGLGSGVWIQACWRS